MSDPMELPILTPNYQPTSEAIVRAVQRARAVLARTVAQETALQGANAFTNPKCPDVPAANYAADLRLPDDMDAVSVLDEIMTHFQELGLRPNALEAAATIWPKSLADDIEHRGYQPTSKRIFLLKQHSPSESKGKTSLQIIPARAAYGQLHRYCQSQVTAVSEATEQRAADEAQTIIDHLDEPRLDLYVARMAGDVCGLAGVISLGDMGVIYAPEFGLPIAEHPIAPSMIDHLLNVCARAGMKQVILERTDECDSIPFYESMGFVEVTSTIRYQLP